MCVTFLRPPLGQALVSSSLLRHPGPAASTSPYCCAKAATSVAPVAGSLVGNQNLTLNHQPGRIGTPASARLARWQSIAKCSRNDDRTLDVFHQFADCPDWLPAFGRRRSWRSTWSRLDAKIAGSGALDVRTAVEQLPQRPGADPPSW